MSRDVESPHWIWQAAHDYDLSDALCAQPGMDPESWFIEDPVIEKLALGYCKICPVRRECLEAAYDEESQTGYYAHGIRGGVLARNRQRKLDVMKLEDELALGD